MNTPTVPPLSTAPKRSSYDVVIVGGAVMGSSVAWFLSSNDEFDGSVLVVERDPSYEFTSTARTNSCMRQQYSNELNIRISQFSADYVRNFRRWMGDDPEVPDLAVHHFGYMYLAGDEHFAATLRASQELQSSLGAATVIMSPDEIAAEYPFLNVDDIVCGSHNTVDEGWFDSATMFDWWRRKARLAGVEYLTGEVTAIDRSDGAVDGSDAGQWRDRLLRRTGQRLGTASRRHRPDGRTGTARRAPQALHRRLRRRRDSPPVAAAHDRPDRRPRPQRRRRLRSRVDTGDRPGRWVATTLEWTPTSGRSRSGRCSHTASPPSSEPRC